MEPLKTAAFRCLNKHNFEAIVDRVEDNDNKPHHPFNYFAKCPECGVEASQAHWEVNLIKAHSKATGPKTEGGKSQSTNNLLGHNTDNTRWNAVKHGLFARVATFYPARPGKYPHCDNCEHLNNGCEAQSACLKRTELFMKHDIAFKTNNPSLLRKNRSDIQAAFSAILNDIILAITTTGVEIRTPKYYINPKTGKAELVYYLDESGERQVIEDISENPMLKRMIDFMQRNSLTLDDMGMTQKAQEEISLSGQLVETQQIGTQSAIEFQQKQQSQNQQLLDLINQGRVNAIPTTIEAE